MNVAVSGLADSLDRVYDEWETRRGFGPCGAYAALKRQEWGMAVAVCTASDGLTEFTHYVLVDAGEIVDWANPLGEPLTYTDIEVLDADEMPELVEQDVIAWLRERGV